MNCGLPPSDCLPPMSLEADPLLAQKPESSTNVNELSDRFRKAMAEIDASESKNSAVSGSKEIPKDWSATDTMTMSIAVLTYSVVVLIVAAVVLRMSKAPEVALRLLITILIITSSVFLVVAGYSSQQIAPAFGLLGTMAGYVLGKGQSGRTGPDDPERPGS